MTQRSATRTKVASGVAGLLIGVALLVAAAETRAVLLVSSAPVLQASVSRSSTTCSTLCTANGRSPPSS
jgi:hypothetical protein